MGVVVEMGVRSKRLKLRLRVAGGVETTRSLLSRLMGITDMPERRQFLVDKGRCIHLNQLELLAAKTLSLGETWRLCSPGSDACLSRTLKIQSWEIM